MFRRGFLSAAAAALATATVTAADARPAKRATLRSRYAANVAALETRRNGLAIRLADATSASERARVLHRAERALLAALDAQLFPAWLGTTWDFNGTTTEPGRGAIACGYFVSTLLLHAGFRVERVRLAQQPSERIVKTLCAEPAVRRYRKGDVSAVADDTRERGDGLYVVGLDNHVGLLRVKKDAVAFWHASYGDPAVVSREDPEASPCFASAYHVVGEVTTSRALTQWLRGEAWSTTRS